MSNEIKIEFTFKNVPSYVLEIIKKAEIKIESGNIDIQYNSSIHNEVFANICSLYKIYELENDGTLEKAVQEVADKLLKEASEQIAEIVYQNNIASKLN